MSQVKEIDNSSIIQEKILKFSHNDDFFIVHVMRRKKDGNPRDEILKTKFVYSFDYWKSRIDEWKGCCRANNARLYIVPTRRRTSDVVIHSMRRLLDNIAGHYQDRLNDFMRSAACECHKSDRKRWVIDVDRNDAEKRGYKGFEEYRDACTEYVCGGLPDEVIKKELFNVDTPNGCHIVTPPFEHRSLEDVTLPFCRKDVKKDDMTLVFSVTDACYGCPSNSISCGCLLDLSPDHCGYNGNPIE